MTRAKTLMLWLLLLALPIQGFAAVARLSCGVSHHAGAVVMPDAAVALASHAVSDHVHQAHHDHHMAGGHEHSSPASQADTLHAGVCSACAACCVGALALPARVTWTPAIGASFAPMAAPVARFTSHISSGPERPPRPLLA